MYDRNARKLVLAARVFTDSASRATNEGIEGGSEFKAEFEQACRAKAIRLYELPPRRPQINGAVGRYNGCGVAIPLHLICTDIGQRLVVFPGAPMMRHRRLRSW